MKILSIQSWVAYGHVGNAAAAFPLQRLGADVWALQTVQFSNHPGYGHFTGETFSGAAIASLVAGIAARGVLSTCDAVLSGYIGSAETGAAVLQAVAQVRAANPAAIYCCDPVFGDDGPGLYVAPGVLAAQQAAMAQADIATPNRFELARLTGLPVDDLSGAVTAVTALRATMRPNGRRIVLVTSLPDDPGHIGLLAGDAAGVWRLRTPRLPASFNGAGDLLAALFLFHILQSGSTAAALERAGSSLHGVLAATVAAGARELRLVEAQDELVAPSQWFAAAPLTDR